MSRIKSAPWAILLLGLCLCGPVRVRAQDDASAPGTRQSPASSGHRLLVGRTESTGGQVPPPGRPALQNGRFRSHFESAACGTAQAGVQAIQGPSHPIPAQFDCRVAGTETIQAGSRRSGSGAEGLAGVAATPVERRSVRSLEDRNAAHAGDHQGTQTPATIAAFRPRPNRRRCRRPKELAQKQAKVADRTGELAQQLEEADAQATEQAGPERSRRPMKKSRRKNRPRNRTSGRRRIASPPTTSRLRTSRLPTTDRLPSRRVTRRRPVPSRAKPSRLRKTPSPHSRVPRASRPSQGRGSPNSHRRSRPRMIRHRPRNASAKPNRKCAKRSRTSRNPSVPSRWRNKPRRLQKLEEAIAELEEVLRQLREEEMERVLALLEGRFRQMLVEEIKIYEATQRLDKTPEEERGRNLDIRANKLAFDQRKVGGQADRCLTLLLEEGSSVAFPGSRPADLATTWSRSATDSPSRKWARSHRTWNRKSSTASRK